MYRFKLDVWYSFLQNLSYCFSSVQRIAPACFCGYSAMVKEHFDLTSFEVLVWVRSPLLCILPAWLFCHGVLCFFLKFISTFLFIYFYFFFYFSSSFVYISVKLVENEYSHSWPHAVSFLPTLLVCMCPIFCIFFWQCLPFRAALNFASSVMTIFPEQENTILLPSQAILVDGGYFLS